jgi:hypothetical protein
MAFPTRARSAGVTAGEPATGSTGVTLARRPVRVTSVGPDGHGSTPMRNAA